MKRLFQLLVCVAVAVVATSVNVEAKVRLPRLVSDGMVLQRDTPLEIHGWADPKEKVVVVFQDKTLSTRANRTGEWSVELGSFPAGGPYTMQVGDVTLSDVMVGEVWLCSGQSNMELQMFRTRDLYADAMKGFDYPDIRYFRVPMNYAFTGPEKDIPGGEWRAATPENIPMFSAIAFFYGRELHELYGIPVGVIDNSIGGSPIEAWVSARTLEKYPHYLAAARECARPGFVDSMRTADMHRGRERHQSIEQADPGVGVWNKADFDHSDWGTVSMPGYWRTKGIETGPGTIWFRREFELPAGVEASEAILRMGVIVDADSTWVNGVYVGNVTYMYPPRVYRVPAGVLREGRNVVATRVTTNSGDGGFVEQKPYKLIVGASSEQLYQMVPAAIMANGAEQQVDKPLQARMEVDLTGDWRYRIGAQPTLPAPGRSITFQYVPTGLYNGMLAPLRGFALRGFLWYQGESNVGRAVEYREIMADLISEWRRDWNSPEMPFIFAQLTSMMEGSGFGPETDESGWAEFRDIQRQTLRLPHTGMATTLDVGEWNDIHPLNKQTVAHRMVLEARRLAYGESGVSGAGPLPEKMTVEKGSAVISFLCIGSDIDPNLRLAGFSIAGNDKKFVKANAVVLRGNTLRVWSELVPEPAFVRYAWAGDPVGANLRDKEGIPAPTFEIGILAGEEAN
jgi:sialate O-acetylesterase